MTSGLVPFCRGGRHFEAYGSNTTCPMQPHTESSENPGNSTVSTHGGRAADVACVHVAAYCIPITVSHAHARATELRMPLLTTSRRKAASAALSVQPAPRSCALGGADTGAVATTHTLSSRFCQSAHTGRRSQYMAATASVLRLAFAVVREEMVPEEADHLAERLRRPPSRQADDARGLSTRERAVGERKSVREGSPM